jgi:hypothetical protein
MLEGETIIKQGKANKTSFFNAQGGELALTNKRLVFVGHGKNIGEGTIAINLDDVLTFGKASTFTLFFPIPIPNAFKISLQNGKTYKFTVSKKKEWLEELNKTVNKQHAL